MYPDYTNPKTAEWWIQMCMEFKNILDYDGIWIVSPDRKVKSSPISLFFHFIIS